MIDLDQFQRRVSHVARGCPTAVLRDAILQAAEDFCERTWLWKDEAASVITVDGETEYSIPAPVGTDILAVADLALDGNRTPFTSPLRDTVRLWSAPAPGLELVATVVLKPNKRSKGLPDRLYNEWLDAVSAGARAKLLDMPGTDWFSPQLAEKYRIEFDRVWVPRARVEISRGNDKPMVVRKRRFI